MNLNIFFYQQFSVGIIVFILVVSYRYRFRKDTPVVSLICGIYFMFKYQVANQAEE